jgi:hypothetical protein
MCCIAINTIQTVPGPDLEDILDRIIDGLAILFPIMNGNEI